VGCVTRGLDRDDTALAWFSALPRYCNTFGREEPFPGSTRAAVARTVANTRTTPRSRGGVPDGAALSSMGASTLLWRSYGGDSRVRRSPLRGSRARRGLPQAGRVVSLIILKTVPIALPRALSGVSRSGLCDGLISRIVAPVSSVAITASPMLATSSRSGLLSATTAARVARHPAPRQLRTNDATGAHRQEVTRERSPRFPRPRGAWPEVSGSSGPVLYHQLRYESPDSTMGAFPCGSYHLEHFAPSPLAVFRAMVSPFPQPFPRRLLNARVGSFWLGSPASNVPPIELYIEDLTALE